MVTHAYSDRGKSIFEPGSNCWRVETAWHASVLVDCGNYYRDLHEALSKAKHSIFITGWDIDSRIEMIRDNTDKNRNVSVSLFELLTEKARQNPDLQIYLNRWNYTFYMAVIREPMTEIKWQKSALPNIHYCHDDMVPMGACHHQKIVIVDDEVAFTGGMDVAIGRWDMRSHMPVNPKRKDPGGVYDPHLLHSYTPYHDIQTVVSGPVVRALAEISRKRWKMAAGYDAVPMRPEPKARKLPDAWPDSDPPDFENITVAVARTLPRFSGIKPTYEIEQLYLDEIKEAKKFIYIENQYLTFKGIAHALYNQMKKNPDLRVLMVSSYNPQGFVEKLVMWSGRINFGEIVLKGEMKKRAALAYPISVKGEKAASVRIHSKLMIVDDIFLHIGSANLNNRSMRMDTECDLVYLGETVKSRKKIADVRNDLIREHTGYEADHIQRMIDAHVDPNEFLKPLPTSRQHLVKVDDKEFFSGVPNDFANSLADPLEEIMPPIPLEGIDQRYFPRRKLIGFIAFLIVACIVALVWKSGLFGDYGIKESIITLFENIQKSPGSAIVATVAYTVCVMLFVPITLLTGINAIIFGYWKGLVISMVGALLSGALGYGIGHYFKDKFARVFTGNVIHKIKQNAENSSVAGITFIRMLPIAPFSVVNIAFGLMHVPFLAYMAGTFFGLVPGKLVGVFIADSIWEMFKNPELDKLVPLAAGMVAWLLAIWGTHVAYRAWKKRKTRKNGKLKNSVL